MWLVIRTPVVAVVVAWLLVLSYTDIRHRRLPNRFTLPGAGAMLLGALVAGRGTAALAGAAALTSVYLLVHLLAPAALGAGDVKLAIGLGALAGSLGVEVWFLAALAAPLMTALWAVGARQRTGALAVPHGPSMCLATAVAAGLALLG